MTPPTWDQAIQLAHEVAIGSWPVAFVALGVYYRGVVRDSLVHACTVFGGLIRDRRDRENPPA